MISVSSKYMVQNTQCIIHGPVGKEVFWANSPKYIVQNEPSQPVEIPTAPMPSVDFSTFGP